MILHIFYLSSLGTREPRQTFTGLICRHRLTLHTWVNKSAHNCINNQCPRLMWLFGSHLHVRYTQERPLEAQGPKYPCFDVNNYTVILIEILRGTELLDNNVCMLYVSIVHTPTIHGSTLSKASQNNEFRNSSPLHEWRKCVLGINLRMFSCFA